MEKGNKTVKAVSACSNLTDYELIKLIQDSGDNDSYIELKTRYEKVYFSMCHRYLRAAATLGVKEEDILESVDYVLFNSARTFDFSRKLKFSTWLSNQARYLCLNSMRKGQKNMDFFNTNYNTTESNEEETHKLENEMKKTSNRKLTEDNITFTSRYFDSLEDNLDKQILSLRYWQDKRISWRKIGEKFSLNGRVCKEIHDQAIMRIRDSIRHEPVFENL